MPSGPGKLFFDIKSLSGVYNFWSTRPTTVRTGSDHYFHTDCPSVRPSVPKLQNQATITGGRVCGLAKWIIDDSCLVFYIANGKEHKIHTSPTFIISCLLCKSYEKRAKTWLNFHFMWAIFSWLRLEGCIVVNKRNVTKKFKIYALIYDKS